MNGILWRVGSVEDYQLASLTALQTRRKSSCLFASYEEKAAIENGRICPLKPE